MKAYCIAIASIALGLAGCASTGGGSSESSTYVPAKKSPGQSVEDDYIARVEQIAIRRGIRVQWVNAPRKTSQTAD